MLPALSATLYAVVLATAFACSHVEPQIEASAGARLPLATITAELVVGVPSLIQLAGAAWLLPVLERDWSAIADGQLWRLVTSLVVQDGGLAGTVFNLVAMAVIGVAAEQAWGARRWVVLALASGIGAQLWGWVVQPVGAGNSVVVFGLAASLSVLSLRAGTNKQRLLGTTSLLAAAVLLLAGDLHGGAAAVGAVLAATFSLAPGRTPQTHLGNSPRAGS